MMPRFYFDVETRAGVEHDSTGVDAGDPLKVLSDFLDVLPDVIDSTEFNHLRGVTIKGAQREVIATINVEAIRQAMYLTGNAGGADDDTA